MIPSTLLVLTDGRRDCLERTMASAATQLGFDHFAQRVIIDDSADTHHWRTVARLAEVHDCQVFKHMARRGFAGAVRTAWETISPEARFVFHLEDDFVFLHPVELDRMVAVLGRHPTLAQMALLRQPWNAEEKAAGGIIQKDPNDFKQVQEGDDAWVVHRRFFTTNPSLYPADLTRTHGWPDVEHSEGHFTHQLLEDSETFWRFAFWGNRDDPPRVEHIGDQRVGSGY